MDKFYLPEDWSQILSFPSKDEDNGESNSSGQFIKSILDEIPAFIHIVDQQTGKILWCNAAWERFFHISCEEVINHSKEVYKKIIHPEDLSLMKTSNDHYRNGDAGNFGGVIRVKYPDETGWRWLIGISRVIRTDSEGIPLLTLAVFMDFTSVIYTREQVQTALRDALNRQNREVWSKITRREKQVIQLLVKGKSTAEIAGELFISQHTVISHRKNIRMKLNVKNTSSLISYLKEIGI